MDLPLKPPQDPPESPSKPHKIRAAPQKNLVLPGPLILTWHCGGRCIGRDAFKSRCFWKRKLKSGRLLGAWVLEAWIASASPFFIFPVSFFQLSLDLLIFLNLPESSPIGIRRFGIRQLRIRRFGIRQLGISQKKSEKNI